MSGVINNNSSSLPFTRSSVYIVSHRQQMGRHCLPTRNKGPKFYKEQVLLHLEKGIEEDEQIYYRYQEEGRSGSI